MKVPPKFRCPALPKYQGSSDPLDHLATFLDSMALVDSTDPLLCRVFLTTLVDSARGWFTRLPPGCISTFLEFRKLFLSYFSSAKKPLRTSQHLFSLKQDETESLRDYLTRFKAATNEVIDSDPMVSKMAITVGLKKSPFKWSLSKNPPLSLTSLLEKATQYINAEEADLLESARDLQTQVQSASLLQTGFIHQAKKQKTSSQQTASQSQGPALPAFTKSLPAILAAIRDRSFFYRPPPLRSAPDQRSQTKFCLYHDEHGHLTDDCRDLKVFLARLCQQGLLDEFLAPTPRQPRDDPQSSQQPQTLSRG